MPIGVDPELSVGFSLPIDQKIDEKTRTIFYAHFPTARQAAKLSQALDQAIKTKDPLKSLDMFCQVVSIYLVGWRNLVDRSGQAVVFDKNKPVLDQVMQLPDILSDSEMWDLNAEAMKTLRAKETELGKLESPSGSNTASSAESVGPEAQEAQAAA